MISNNGVFDPNEYNEANIDDFEEHERKINELKSTSLFNAESSIDESYNYLNLANKTKKVHTDLEKEQGSPFLGEIYDEENNNIEKRLEFLINDIEDAPKEVSMSKFQTLNSPKVNPKASNKGKIITSPPETKNKEVKKVERMSDNSHFFENTANSIYKSVPIKRESNAKENSEFKFPESSIIDNLDFGTQKIEPVINEPSNEVSYDDLRVSSYEEGLMTPEALTLKRKKEEDKEKDISNLSTDEQLKIISKQKITRTVPSKQDTLESLISKISNNALTEDYSIGSEDDFDFSIGDPDEVVVPIKEDGTVDLEKAGISLKDLETKPVGKNTNPFKDSN